MPVGCTVRLIMFLALVFGMKIKFAMNAGIRVIMHVLFPAAFVV